MDANDPTTRRAVERIGRVLREKWRLDSLLGVGGMASVYAATHRNGKRGAVKMLHLELSLDASCRARFLREGYVANKVDHPGAVSVLDDDVAEDGAVFLVMELLEGAAVEGCALARPGRRLEVAEVVAVGDALLDVLAAAHPKGIIHRDLKPENLFITKRGELKVLDYGIARLREGDSATATKTGSLMGTPAFMPPEQALGNVNQVDGRTDLWATGATMFSLLTGRAVHEGDTLNKVLLAAMSKPAPPVASLLTSLPPPIAMVIDRALAFEQAARWADATTMQRALRDAAARSGVSPRLPLPGDPGPRASSVAASEVERPSGVHAMTAAMSEPHSAHATPFAPAAPSQPMPGTFSGATVAPRASNAGKIAGLVLGLLTLGAIGIGVTILLRPSSPGPAGVAAATADLQAPPASAASAAPAVAPAETALASAAAEAPAPEPSAAESAAPSATPAAKARGPARPGGKAQPPRPPPARGGKTETERDHGF